MGSIINRDGRWRALVRRKGFAAQCKTFGSQAEAKAWVRKVEAAMDSGQKPPDEDVTISGLIKAYRKLRDKARPISDSSNEHYQLKTLDRLLGSYRAARITPDDLVGFAAARKDEGAGPYTVNMDISRLGTVYRYGAASLRISLPDVVGSARPLLTHLRLIGGGNKRERRPTEDEMQRLVAYLREQHGDIYADATEFAAASAMRRGEVCALTWEAIDTTARIASIERKHPRKGKTLERVPLLPASWAILERQPGREGSVFGCHEQTLTKYFTWACRALSIPDLHFHDLRHHGTSQMFEEGMSIEQVALVTGHKSWAMLKRYTHLRPEDVVQAANSRTESKNAATSR